MTKPSYEFRHVSTKQKVYLLLFKGFFICIILSSLASLALIEDSTLGDDLLNATGTMIGIFGYINLMRVKVEVQEIFEPPIQWAAPEFTWLAMIFLVISYFV